MLIILLIIGAVWLLTIVLAVALCAAARMGDTEIAHEGAPAIKLRRTRTRRFRSSAA